MAAAGAAEAPATATHASGFGADATAQLVQELMQAMAPRLERLEQGFATQMQQMAQQTQEMEQRLQKEIAESRTDMADMAQSLRTEMKAILQNEMQDSLAPIMQQALLD